MDNKNKLKTFVIGAVTTLLTSCGFKGNDAPRDDAKVQNPTESVVENESIDKVINIMADEVHKTHWESLTDITAESEAVKSSDIIKSFLEKNKIPYEKGDSVLRSVDWVLETESNLEGHRSNGLKLVNPVYEKAQKMKKSNIEHHERVTIHRKEYQEQAQQIKTISLSDVTLFTKDEHFEKVKKMVEDKKLEQGLHKGDTVEVKKLVPPSKNSTWDLQYKTEKAVVQKDGVSPTYKEYDKTKTQRILKLKFGYTYDDK
ncbi:MAG: hypothetical protein IJ770_03465 [Alphaproteobacteria bacterium]|nr:hypothetical protein [Alphaproteobacteria bacterium]